MSAHTVLSRVTPLLRSTSEGEAKAFYVGLLGFKIDFEHRFEPHLPLYFGVSRGSCTLHITEHEGDAALGASVRIECADVDAFCAELTAKLLALQAPHALPSVQHMPWGTRDLHLTDPFGNRLTFTSAISL